MKMRLMNPERSLRQPRTDPETGMQLEFRIPSHPPRGELPADTAQGKKQRLILRKLSDSGRRQSSGLVLLWLGFSPAWGAVALPGLQAQAWSPLAIVLLRDGFLSPEPHPR